MGAIANTGAQRNGDAEAAPTQPTTRPRMNGERPRNPSMTDVAALANVSYQTVSRVLNGHPNVKASTRSAVQRAIDQLGYRPNNAARTLVTGRSNTLGVITLDVDDSDGLPPMYGIERSAREHGYFVGTANLDYVDRASVRAAVDYLSEQRVAGLMVIAPIETASDALASLPSDIPVVAIEGQPGRGIATAAVDQEVGARKATEHLLELGHETVFHVRGPSDWMQTQDRISGWQGALLEAGREAPMPLAGDWSPRSGYEAGLMLARIPDLTAVFAGNDEMALGLLLAFSERGLRVPEDVSVVGFDDGDDPGYYNPPLTTIRQDFRAVGRRAIEMLVDQIRRDQRDDERFVIEPELILRKSTGPARQR